MGVRRRRCRCTVAGLPLLLLPPLATLSAALALGSADAAAGAEVEVEVDAGAEAGPFDEFSSSTDSLTVSKAGCNLGAAGAVLTLFSDDDVVAGGPVGPLCVCGAWDTPLVRPSMLA